MRRAAKSQFWTAFSRFRESSFLKSGLVAGIGRGLLNPSFSIRMPLMGFFFLAGEGVHVSRSPTVLDMPV